MLKEYEKDVEDYKKIKEIYESSLTEQQKEDIKRVKEEMAAAKEKRRLKAVSYQTVIIKKLKQLHSQSIHRSIYFFISFSLIYYCILAVNKLNIFSVFLKM